MRELRCHWQGPYAWPKTKSSLPPLPDSPGLYLQTFEYLDGYLIYGAGLTRRSVAKRLKEHTAHYRDGMYTVLNAREAQLGVRSEVWHGFWTKARSPERVADFEARKCEIQDAADAQLLGFRVFLASIGTEPRTLERLEAATMKQLYQKSAPFSELPDKGMMLTGRRPTEEPIMFRGECDKLLHALPREYEI